MIFLHGLKNNKKSTKSKKTQQRKGIKNKPFSMSAFGDFVLLLRKSIFCLFEPDFTSARAEAEITLIPHVIKYPSDQNL